jgi:hypothetical protein
MKALWRGELPLVRAFWEFAILYVAPANVCATGAAFALLAADMPTALAVVVFLLPLPYVLVSIVGVWRSAASYRGPPYWAMLARYSSMMWGGFMVLI